MKILYLPDNLCYNNVTCIIMHMFYEGILCLCCAPFRTDMITAGNRMRGRST